jgi:hypothetical protein
VLHLPVRIGLYVLESASGLCFLGTANNNNPVLDKARIIFRPLQVPLLGTAIEIPSPAKPVVILRQNYFLLCPHIPPKIAFWLGDDFLTLSKDLQ